MNIAILRLFFASFLLTNILFAQQTVRTPDKETSPVQSAPATTIVSHTQFVLVPVVVRDKSGKHIEHLTKDKFHIEENGKDQTISAFEEYHTVTVEPAKHPDTPTVYSNFASTDSRAYRATIIVLDFVNTPILKQQEGQQHLLKYLSSSLRSDEPTAIFALKRHGLRQVASLTTDPKVLIAAVGQVHKEVDGGTAVEALSETGTADPASRVILQELAGPAGDGTMSSQAVLRNMIIREFHSLKHEEAVTQHNAIAETLEALNTLARIYAAIPGRKTLIWVTAGFPFLIDDTHSFQGLGGELIQDYENTWRQLTSANIAVYPVNAEGLVDTNFLPGGDMDLKRGRMVHPNDMEAVWRITPYNPHEERAMTLRSVAAATGGRPCLDTNDLAKCFASAVDDSSTYFMLGYYLNPNDHAPGWRKLSVKVSAPDAHISTRQGFYVAPPVKDPLDQQRRLVNLALHAPVEFTGVHFAVQPLPLVSDTNSPDSGKLRQRFLLQIPPTSIAINRRTKEINLEVGMFAVNDKDEAVGRISKSLKASLKPEMVADIAQNGIVLSLELELPPGEYVVKTVVQDNLNDQIGTVNFPFEVKRDGRGTVQNTASIGAQN
jgi:VWFA-related protein